MVLQPIISLNIKDFTAKREIDRGHLHSKILDKDYAGLYNIFQSIITDKLSNKDIVFKIEEIKKQKDKQLIVLHHASNSDYYAPNFNQDIIELIHDSKTYLAIIL